VKEQDLAFIAAFDEAMHAAGYVRYKLHDNAYWNSFIAYIKPGSKTPKIIARIYLHDNTVLRVYASGIDKCRAYLEAAPALIQQPFIDDSHQCKPCKGMRMANGKCRYQKTYTLHGSTHVKCAEQSFCYTNLAAKDAQDYVNLVAAFYPVAAASVRSLQPEELAHPAIASHFRT